MFLSSDAMLCKHIYIYMILIFDMNSVAENVEMVTVCLILVTDDSFFTTSLGVNVCVHCVRFLLSGQLSAELQQYVCHCCFSM